MSSSNTPSTPAAVVLSCSECGHGSYVLTGDDTAGCDTCGKVITPSQDVVPYLDAGEQITTTRDTATRTRLLAYFPADD